MKKTGMNSGTSVCGNNVFFSILARGDKSETKGSFTHVCEVSDRKWP